MSVTHVQEEIQDIMHYMEFNNLSASLGYKAYKELQDASQRRRELKDELDYLKSIEKRSKNALKHQDGLNQIVSGIEQTESNHQTRVYTPRIRKDLFEN